MWTLIMLFFYALLFFLFCNSVVSTPLRSNTPAPGQGRRPQGHGIQRSATSLGHRPATSQRRPEDGYWVLKRPQQGNGYPERVLRINDGIYNVFTLNNQLRYRQNPMRVTGNLKLGLVGSYTQIPTLGTPAEHRFRELRINPDERRPGNIVLQFLDTRGVQWWNPPGGYEVTNNQQTNGYWVLGDMTAHQTLTSWYEILRVNNGVYQTFQLEDLFTVPRYHNRVVEVIGASALQAINSGRYFRIPIHDDGTLPYQRFDILTYQPIHVHPGYSLNIFNQEGDYVDVWNTR
ncbi:hypothetical protein F5887DRAFT_991227 [Amanita rubescens]|nr:hypothetical protein F5887DRAFT_991227 [Amanita rubescens]